MADIKEQISANRRDAQWRLNQVREDPRLSDEGKRQRLYEVHSQALERHHALVAQHEAEQHSRLHELHHRLFAPRFTIGQPDYQRDSIRSEYRKNLSEADKVLSEDGVEGLQRYLEMAVLSGDALASRAAFAVAHSRGYEPVVTSYLEAHPDARETYEEYQKLDREIRNPNPSDLFAQSFGLAPPPMPPEIVGFRPPGAEDPDAVILGAGDWSYRGAGV